MRISVTTHELKVWPAYYEAIVRGEKRFEARKDDRGFQVGDVLFLREWDPDRNDGTRYGVFTGRELRRTVTYILRGPGFGVEDGFVVMSIESECDAQLRERAEKAERDLREEELRVSQLNAELNEKHARLARYEAPGPALLTAEHDSDCTDAFARLIACRATCTKPIREDAYREQHARCVAVVGRDALEQMLKGGHGVMSEDIDTLRAQLAHVAQLLGSPTVSAEAAACIAVKRADELRERAEKAEDLAHIDPEHRFTTWRERCEETGQDLREAQARLARYEAPGPALLYVECGDHDVVCESDVDTPCICAVGVAYREQHARCVALISALKATHNNECIAYEAAAGRRRCRAHGCDGDVIEYGFELALAALTGEAGK